jgi:site-specific DNA recombinase
MDNTCRSKKAALYVRVSTDEQAEKGTSLSTQEERLKAFCVHEGIEMADVYSDDGYSGATLDRPGLQRLLADARQEKFNLVLVYKLDRLSRNLKDAVNLVLGDLESDGIGFRSITEPFNTLEPAGKVMFANLASFADYEREQIRERCIRGRIMRNREGRYTGGRLPYGVAWNKEKMAFEIVEEEARVYRMIFDLFVNESLSLGQVARRLEEKGLTTRAGALFSADYVRFLLASPTACGNWQRHRVVNRPASDPRLQRNLKNSVYDKRGLRPLGEWITVPVPALVSREQWDRAQDLLAVHRKPFNNTPSALCLGLIFCGECGSRVGIRHKRKRDGKYRRYGCRARIYRRDKRYPRYREIACDMPFFPQDEIDSLVWGKVEELIDNPTLLWEAVYGGGAESRQAEQKTRVADLRRQLAQAKAQEARAARLYTLGTVVAVAEKQVKEAASRRRALEQEMEQAEKSLKLEQGKQEMKEQAFELFRALRSRLGNLTLEEKREILRILVPGGLTHRIELHEDGTVLMRGVIDFDSAALGMSMPYSSKHYFK